MNAVTQLSHRFKLLIIKHLLDSNKEALPLSGHLCRRVTYLLIQLSLFKSIAYADITFGFLLAIVSSGGQESYVYQKQSYRHRRNSCSDHWIRPHFNEAPTRLACGGVSSLGFLAAAFLACFTRNFRG
jgi:hypothetical protein